MQRRLILVALLPVILTAGCGSGSVEASISVTGGNDASTTTLPDGATAPPPIQDDGSIGLPVEGGVVNPGLKPPPNPIISRGKNIVSNQPNAAFLVDGKYANNQYWTATNPSAAATAWAAIDIGTGPTKLLLEWSGPGGGYMDTTAGAPMGYTVDTSADSTDGKNGTWKTVATVTDNGVKIRAHAFDFTGQRWVRFSVNAAASNAGGKIALDEIDVYDGTKGVADSWIFIGDSITALTYDRAPTHEPTFTQNVHAAAPDYFPAMLGSGIGGTNSGDGVKNIDAWIAINPDIHFWAVCYGTNDAVNDGPQFVPPYEANLRTIIGKLQKAGKVVLLPDIPYSSSGHTSIPLYNAVIDKLRTELGLPPGPNLYAYFQAHPDQLYDGVHPTAAGSIAMQRLWADAVAPIYK